MISSEIQHLLCSAVQCICVVLTWMGFDWIEWRSRFCTPHLHYTVHCAILTVHCAPTKLCTMQYRVDCAIHCNTVHLPHCALGNENQDYSEILQHCALITLCSGQDCNTLCTLYTYHTVHCAIQTRLLFAIHCITLWTLHLSHCALFHTIWTGHICASHCKMLCVQYEPDPAAPFPASLIVWKDYIAAPDPEYSEELMITT